MQSAGYEHFFYVLYQRIEYRKARRVEKMDFHRKEKSLYLFLMYLFLMQDHHQQEQINVLEHRLDNLTDLVYKLHDEMFNLNKQVHVMLKRLMYT